MLSRELIEGLQIELKSALQISRLMEYSSDFNVKDRMDSMCVFSGERSYSLDLHIVDFPDLVVMRSM